MIRSWRIKTLDRYIAATIAWNIVVALATLVAVFSVINASEELKQVGIGQYGVGDALRFVLLTLPNEAYGLLPAAAMLGTVLGLGGLARGHEIVAMAAAGVSRMRLIRSGLRPAVPLMIAGVLFGELMAAPLAGRARTARSVALSAGLTVTTTSGVWTRTGASFINIRTLRPDGAARDVYVYDFDDQHRMQQFTYARGASYTQGHWTLEGVVDNRITSEGVASARAATRTWDTVLSPQQLRRILVPPEELSVTDLYRGIVAARRQGESWDHLELALWQRVTMPVVTAIMVFLAVTVVLTSLHAATFARRVAAGALLGVGFQMLNETFASFGLVYGLAPWLSATLPALAALAAGVWYLKRRPA